MPRLRIDRWCLGTVLLSVGLGLTPVAHAQMMTTKELLALPQPQPDTVIHYGADSLQFGELRLPRAKGIHPVVVVIHGGCWMSAFGVNHARSESEALRAAGVAVWTIEYRRVGSPGGGWPGTFEDVGAAIDYLRHLEQPFHLDLSRVVLVGHSSGGHLAVWAAARPKLDRAEAIRGRDPLPVHGVVSLAGVPDLRLPLKTSPPTCGDAILRLIGDTSLARLRITSPAEVVPLGIPQTLIGGAEDPIVPAAWANDYADLARKAGDHVTVRIIPHASHFEIIAPGKPAWNEVLAAVLAMVK